MRVLISAMRCCLTAQSKRVSELENPGNQRLRFILLGSFHGSDLTFHSRGITERQEYIGRIGECDRSWSRYDSNIFKSSAVMSWRIELFCSRIASASSRFCFCNSAIFSSTVPLQMSRYAKTCRV